MANTHFSTPNVLRAISVAPLKKLRHLQILAAIFSFGRNGKCQLSQN